MIVHSMDELQEELQKYNSEDIYVIGGDSIYRQMLDLLRYSLYHKRSIMPMKPTHICQIWKKIRHGR